uniref:Uncharacterized protein n=1 Tax=Schistocephalus solidus TaxID=70667 RepID=A0A0X3Q7J3_SCHSO
MGITIKTFQVYSKFNRANGRRLLVAMTDFRAALKWTYGVGTSTSCSGPCLFEFRSQVAHTLSWPENGNDKYICCNMNKSYATLLPALLHVSIIEDRYNDSRAPLISHCLFNHPMEPVCQC